MKRHQILIASLTMMFLMGHVHVHAQPSVTIHADQPTVTLSPYLYGLFFEDINFGADGGLYAELIQNRSFEYYPVRGEMNQEGYKLTPMTAWEKIYRDGGTADIIVTRTLPLNEVNLNNLEINVTGRQGYAGVANTGYDGIPLTAGENYHFSIYARMQARERALQQEHRLVVALEDEDGTVLDKTGFDPIPEGWTPFRAVLKPSASTGNGRLVILAEGEGKFQIDMVSLFPQNTYKQRENGLRRDMVEALVALNPSFLRFPGGCILHGWGIDNVYHWKETVGEVSGRKPNWNRWGYHQTYGLGYYEYFLLCEDLGATPLPVIPVGVSCSFTHLEAVPIAEMGPVVQDALDLVEFANGPPESRWGKVRAEMGHPESFGLKYVCLGNEEDDTPEFRERIPLFVKAFKETYPEIKLIGTSGLSPRVPLYELMDELQVWSSDEHYYMQPRWFIENQDRFDRWDRSRPKVFVGEYASEGNRLFNALAEAVYLTGVERNGDVVEMTAYAPLFARYGHTQWTRANLIWFDDQMVVKTPNYYVQQLFAKNKGDVYLKNHTEKWPGKEVAISTTYDKATGELIIKAVNASETDYNIAFRVEGAGRVAKKGTGWILQGERDAFNSRETPYAVQPAETTVITGRRFNLNTPGLSLQVIRIAL
ncbi:MAG: alpha-N-arabinofuranosidase [Bacteroidales bacterium]|nr:alpha-N-arabinofuranosidase [Bacteroidales bacterium]